MKEDKTKFFSNFENSLKELNGLVDEMEHGDLTLESAMKKFERAIKLLRECHNAIEKAEQKVQILTVKNDSTELESYQKA